ncbi:MAG: 16S rRNA (cytidine(1402)-2'-O)-methyltransferase [Kiritimatiellaeota bacterium]|nr:16S rRNA (cytidine(1402)-2'-O)-methyltransferase [Kiritimatiellota bacterium]
MLHIVATPIGNLSDLSPRALDALNAADLIACEDTRRTWALLSAFDIPRPELISYRQGNEDRVAERIIHAAQSGRNVVLCSDGGYPGISDPGYRLIRRAAQAQLPYDVIPGVSAVDVALLMSGLSTSSYTFKGFPPRKPGALRRFFEEEKDLPHTLICFESPFRIGAALNAASEVLGDREAAVCIELTKAHERVVRGFLSELIPQFDTTPIKGEATIVIAGNNPKFSNAFAQRLPLTLPC